MDFRVNASQLEYSVVRRPIWAPLTMGKQTCSFSSFVNNRLVFVYLHIAALGSKSGASNNPLKRVMLSHYCFPFFSPRPLNWKENTKRDTGVRNKSSGDPDKDFPPALVRQGVPPSLLSFLTRSRALSFLRVATSFPPSSRSLNYAFARRRPRRSSVELMIRVCGMVACGLHFPCFPPSVLRPESDYDSGVCLRFHIDQLSAMRRQRWQRRRPWEAKRKIEEKKCLRAGGKGTGWRTRGLFLTQL